MTDKDPDPPQELVRSVKQPLVRRSSALAKRGLCDLEKLSSSILELDLSDTETTDDELKNLLAKHTRLRVLNLTRCKQITDAGLVHLKGLTTLEELDLWSCDQITDAGLAHLKGLSNLKVLSLWDCDQITDAGLVHLKGLTTLKWLILNGCKQITDAGLVHLKGLTTLESLYLYRCDKITDAAVSKLEKALPNCKITRPR